VLLLFGFRREGNDPVRTELWRQVIDGEERAPTLNIEKLIASFTGGT
jgi:hypothetical protein